MKDKEILSIIPARGGSKGLPRKNIKPLLGKPLIAWTIEQALNSKYIDKVVVSTDDEEIAEISKEYGAEVPFLRPKELARDDSPTIDAIMHAINWFEERGEFFDILVLLEPTSPLRKRNDIDNALELLINNIETADAIVSVGEVHLENPYIMKKIENGYVKPFIEIDKDFYQRQQLPKVYFPYGVIYASKIETLKKYKTFYQERTIPYFIERWQNYEIDDIYDFICIESILRYKLNEVVGK
jgi:CMP-N-acetylneuraminic acid synthetase